MQTVPSIVHPFVSNTCIDRNKFSKSVQSVLNSRFTSSMNTQFLCLEYKDLCTEDSLLLGCEFVRMDKYFLTFRKIVSHLCAGRSNPRISGRVMNKLALQIMVDVVSSWLEMVAKHLEW